MNKQTASSTPAKTQRGEKRSVIDSAKDQWSSLSLTAAVIAVLLGALLIAVTHYAFEVNTEHRVVAAKNALDLALESGNQQQVVAAQESLEAAAPGYAAGFLMSLGREVSFAMFVAVVVVILVEVRNSRRHAKMLRQALSRMQSKAYLGIYKLRFPKTIFEAIDGQILRKNAYRHDHRLIYSIRRVPHDPTIVECSVRVEYFLRSLSATQIDYPVTVRLAKATSDAVTDKFLGIFIDGTKKETIPKNEGGETYITTTIPLRRRAEVEVWVAAEKTRPAEGMDYWSSNLICTQTTIIVSAPEDMDIQVSAPFTKTADPASVPRIEQIGELDSTTKRWRVEGILLPNNPIFVRWKLKKAQSSITAVSNPDGVLTNGNERQSRAEA